MLILGLLITLLTPSPEHRCPEGSVATGYGPPNDLMWQCIKKDSEDNPIRHGWRVHFWPNANMRSACEYREDIRHGRCSTWNEEGNLLTRGRYEKGVRTGYWWIWGLLEKVLYDPDGAQAALNADKLLVELGVAQEDAPPLAEYLVERHTDDFADIRNAPQLCTPSACVSVSKVQGKIILAVQVLPPEGKQGAADTELPRLTKQATRQRRKIEQARKRRARKFIKAKKGYSQKVRRWDYTSLLCEDGRRSPSCTCGGSYQGCCSYHGGVAGCPRDYPEKPTEDTSPLLPNPLVRKAEDTAVSPTALQTRNP